MTADAGVGILNLIQLMYFGQRCTKSSGEARESILSLKCLLMELKAIYSLLLHRKKKPKQGTCLEFWNSVLEGCV